jgi:NDP-sugar pyrophosphorylase family protein
MDTIEQAVIVAAGHGLGLGPLTKDRPKAMLPVLGKPVIVRLMDRIREAGIQRFIVVVDEHEGSVASYLNSSWVPNAKVQIILQPFPRGLASALACASPYINGPFLLAACDNVIPPTHIPSLLRQFENSRSDVVLSLTPAASGQTAAFPIVQYDGQRISGLTDGPRKSRRDMAAFSIYACGKRIFDHVRTIPLSQRGEREMQIAIQGLLASGGAVTGVQAEWHMHLATELDLLAINKRILREGRDTHILSELPGSVYIRPPVRIDPRVSIGPNTKIGPNVYLESGASIGTGAVVWDSVILNNATVADGEVLHGQIVTRRARIAEEVPVEAPGPFDALIQGLE